ncbi:hypothetical protein D3C76_1818120 [compost metagenome]
MEAADVVVGAHFLDGALDLAIGHEIQAAARVTERSPLKLALEHPTDAPQIRVA